MAHHLVLSGAGIDIDGHLVDVGGREVIRQLRGILGPEDNSAPVGVRGTGRTGHWLRSGVVLISEKNEAELVELHVCFEEGAGPFSDAVPSAARYDGEAVVLGRAFRGGEEEKVVWGLPGVYGFGSLPSARDGRLLVGFSMRRRVGRFGRRTGPRCLVRLSAEWRGVRPFPG